MIKTKYKILLFVSICILTTVFVFNINLFNRSNVAHAAAELSITKTLNGNMENIRIDNIKSYTNYQKRSKSNRDIAKTIFKELLYDDSEILLMSNDQINAIINSNYAIVQQYIIPIENIDDENISPRNDSITPGNPEPGEEIEYSYPDGDYVNWMYITIRVLQNTSKNVGYSINKDNGYSTTEKFGYDVDVTMRWNQSPVWRSDEMMVVAWNKAEKHPTSYLDEASNPLRYYAKNSSDNTVSWNLWNSRHESLYTEGNITYRSLNTRFNLPSIGSGYSNFYANMRLSLVATPMQSFQIFAAYAHRTFGFGTYNVIGLNPISFSASSIDVCATGRMEIEVGSAMQPWPYPN